MVTVFERLTYSPVCFVKIHHEEHLFFNAPLLLCVGLERLNEVGKRIFLVSYFFLFVKQPSSS